MRLNEYDPKGTPEQEQAFEEWYKSPKAQMGFVRKQAFLDGWDAAVFEMGRENMRLRAEVAALRDLNKLGPVAKADEDGQMAFVDALAAEVSGLGYEELALQYASAVANWHYALEMRDAALKEDHGGNYRPE